MVLFWSWVLVTLLAISDLLLATPNTTACADTCASLSHILGEKVVFPGTSNFTQSIGTYYSAQEAELTPSCVVLPSSAEDVSLFIKKLSSVNRAGYDPGYPSCPFAIKGGGHAPSTGAANINRGITLHLGALRQVSLNSDKSVISLGGGSHWGDAYDVLTPLGLSVAGGRNGDVGVAGLLTGGGISFFTARTGFSCDNVKNFEVVLADGSIVSANAKMNRGLWKALRGGSNNFGVVVRFDIPTFPQSNYLGGSVTFLVSSFEAQINAFTNLTAAEVFDPYMSVILTFFWSPQYGFLISNNLAHTSSNSSTSNPPASIQPFLNIQPQLFSTMRTSNVSDFINELTQSGAPLDGLRNSYATTTFQANASFMTEIFHFWNSTMAALTTLPSLASAGMTFEPIPTAITSKSERLGGNSLGLDARDGNLVLLQISLTWTSAADDKTMMMASEKLNNRIDAAAKSWGVFNRWKYLNYAAPYQEVIEGYGTISKSHLRAMSKVYDPLGFFQKVVPGGFKLFT